MFRVGTSSLLQMGDLVFLGCIILETVLLINLCQRKSEICINCNFNEDNPLEGFHVNVRGTTFDAKTKIVSKSKFWAKIAENQLGSTVMLYLVDI